MSIIRNFTRASKANSRRAKKEIVREKAKEEFLAMRESIVDSCREDTKNNYPVYSYMLELTA